MSTLLPYQQRWVDNRGRVKLWDADRQIGSTFAALHEVAEHCLSVRVDGGTCQSLWVADSPGHMSAAKDDYPGMVSQVVWSVGQPTLSANAMAGILGHLGMVVVDSAEPTPGLVGYIAALDQIGVHVRIIVSGSQAKTTEWGIALDYDITLRTTIMDAVADGMGRRVAESMGVEWSPAWEFRWLANLAEVYAGDPDSPRFEWPRNPS